MMLVLGTLASAQTSVREIDIDSGWGGLGSPQSAHLVIKKLNGEYRLNGKRVDASLIEQLVSALRQPAIEKPDAANLGITPEWCKENASEVGARMGSQFESAAANRKELFIKSFNDPAVVAQVIKDLFGFTRFDDYPGAGLELIFEDDTVIEAKTHSYYAFMLPWQVTGKTPPTFNAQISRALAALMPKDTVNKERLAGKGFDKEFGEAVMQHIERDWKLLDARNRAEGALRVIETKYQVLGAEINSYHNVNYGVEWDSGKPHETNLHVTVRKASFPTNLTDEVILRMNGSEAEGVDQFLRTGSKYEDLVLSSPLFGEYIRQHPHTPVWISYVHDASLGDKAMRVFAADMHAIGKDDVVPPVSAQQSQIALVIVGGAYWILFPDRHLLLWRFDGKNGLLNWKPETFAFRRCSDYHPVWGGCVGAEVSADGKRVQDYASADPCAVPTTSSARNHSDEPLFPVHKAGKGGYITKSGEIVIPLRFDTVGEFSHGLARAECAGKWGFINSSGEWVVRPRFAWAQDFSEGLARVQVDGEALTYNSHWAFIDKSGTVVIQPFVEELPSSVSESDDFHDGLAVVEVKSMKGYMDKTGKVVISPKYSYVYPFSESLAAVAVDERGDQWGFIDKSGAMVIPATFNWASSFKNGLAPVNRTPPCGFVDRSGTFVLKPPVADGEKDCATVWGDFDEGLSRWKFGTKYGFIDPTGKTAIPPKFDLTFEFSEGLAAVSVNGKWGYIDKTGEMIINPREYNHVDSFKNGLAYVVTKDGKHGYIDRTGKYVWEPALQGAD
jgi:hypothetical protein